MKQTFMHSSSCFLPVNGDYCANETGTSFFFQKVFLYAGKWTDYIPGTWVITNQGTVKEHHEPAGLHSKVWGDAMKISEVKLKNDSLSGLPVSEVKVAFWEAFAQRSMRHRVVRHVSCLYFHVSGRCCYERRLIHVFNKLTRGVVFKLRLKISVINNFTSLFQRDTMR